MKLIQVRLSHEGFCALAFHTFPVVGKNKKAWCLNKDLYLANISGVERVVVKVALAIDVHQKPYMMDAVTGTLYRVKNGTCCTSDKLFMSSFKKEDGVEKRLYKIKAEIGGDD